MPLSGFRRPRKRGYTMMNFLNKGALPSGIKPPAPTGMQPIMQDTGHPLSNTPTGEYLNLETGLKATKPPAPEYHNYPSTFSGIFQYQTDLAAWKAKWGG